MTILQSFVVYSFIPILNVLSKNIPSYPHLLHILILVGVFQHFCLNNDFVSGHGICIFYCVLILSFTGTEAIIRRHEILSYLSLRGVSRFPLRDHKLKHSVRDQKTHPGVVYCLLTSKPSLGVCLRGRSK